MGWSVIVAFPGQIHVYFLFSQFDKFAFFSSFTLFRNHSKINFLLKLPVSRTQYSGSEPVFRSFSMFRIKYLRNVIIFFCANKRRV